MKVPKSIAKGRRLFRTSSPGVEKRIGAAMTQDAFKTPLAMCISGREGEGATLYAKSLRDGREAEVVLDDVTVDGHSSHSLRSVSGEGMGSPDGFSKHVVSSSAMAVRRRSAFQEMVE